MRHWVPMQGLALVQWLYTSGEGAWKIWCLFWETSLRETGLLPEKNSPAVREGSINGVCRNLLDCNESD